MKREEAWEIWTPQGSRWSAWMKRVLFGFMSDPLPDQAPAVDRGWNAVMSGDAAILVELPGAEAVIAGLQLARFGYRPVPLFNASPYALDASIFDADGFPALVDVMSIMRAMERHTEALRLMHIPEAAPPAFLVDANRSRGPLFPGAGIFDNRSIVRKSDLPSGEVLKSAGIRRVVLVRNGERLSRDLYPILLAWQKAGLEIQSQAYGEEWNPASYTIKQRNAVTVMFGKMLMWLAFKTNSLGNFGRAIHHAAGG